MSASETESDFEFYLRFVKPLIFNLQEPRDRALAAAWVQKLMDKNLGSEDLRTTYLKLLLFVLQRKKLRGIFVENPNHIEGLEHFSEANLHEAARELLATESEVQESPESGDFPPYCTDYSPDLLEYSAVQYIPNFGVHAYYAISNEPLPTWNRIDKVVFPKGIVRRSMTRIKVSTSKFSVTESTLSLNAQGLQQNEKIIRRTKSGNLIRRSSILLEAQPKPRVDKSKHFVRYNLGGAPSGVEQQLRKPTPPKKSNLSNVLLSPPLGVEVRQEGIREAPVWGSNLIPVPEPPVWEPPTDICEDDSDSICYEYHNQPEIIPCPNFQEEPTIIPCPNLRQRTRHSCGCPISPKKRPSSAAAAPEKDNYYCTEFQANYFQAMSLSNLVPPVQSSRNPVPKRRSPMDEHLDQNRRLHSFDFPGEGEVSVFYPSEELSSSMDNDEPGLDSSSFDIPCEGQMRRQIPSTMDDEKSFEKHRFVGFPRKSKFPRPREQQINNYEETEIRVIHPMDKRNFTSSVQSRSGFVISCPGENGTNQRFPNVDAACQSEDKVVPRVRGSALPPIPERQQELYNFKTISQGQAEVNRIIEQTILNTRRIDEDLDAFDKFISEYENKVDYSSVHI